jgi:tetratricopeptide (TPR) repeat protein
VSALRTPQKQGHSVHAPVALDVTDYEAPADLALAGRWTIDRYSIRATLSQLPLGAGAGGFEEAWLDAQGASLRAMPPKQAARVFMNAGNAHNETLQLAVEGGPILAGLWVALLLFMALALWRARLVSLLAMVVALAIVSLGESALHSLGPCVLFSMLIAATPAKTRSIRVSKRKVVGLAIAFGALWLSVAVRAYGATRLLQASPKNVSSARSKAATQMCPERGDLALAYGLALAAEGNSPGAIAQLQRAQSLGAAIAGDIALGATQLEADDAQRAQTAFRRALWRNPGSFRARLDLASSLLEQGRLEDAASELKIAQSLSPGHPMVSDLLERIHQEQMDAESE